MTSDKNIDSCWEKAYRLIEANNQNEAILFCKSEPCASNSVGCQIFLGWLSYESKKLEEAQKWFKRAIDNGSVEGLFGIASVYFVSEDYKSAFAYFKAAADKKYHRACHWAGYMCEHGLGVEKNIDLALSYYECGSQNGYLVAERAIIHIGFKTGTLIDKIFLLLRLMALVVRSVPIAYRNISDERIADIPNVLSDDE